MALKLKNKQVLNLLNEWATDFLNHIDTDTAVQFSAKSPLGSGSLKHSTVNGSYEIEIGIAPLSTSFLAQNKTVDDLNFVKLGIVMFHEFAHYDHNTSEEISKDILLSDLSKFQNNQYYEFNWSVLPHEIDAEYTGVISMWMHLKDIYSNEADKLMIKLQKQYPVFPFPPITTCHTECDRSLFSLFRNPAFSSDCIFCAKIKVSYADNLKGKWGDFNEGCD